jgi:hypothetical protein
MQFRSVHIVGFLIVGLIVTALAGAWAFVGMRNLQWKSAQDQEVELVMRAIEGGALKFAQLNSAALSTQFLGSHFAAISPEGTPRFLSARIEGGRDGTAVYASWIDPRISSVPAACETHHQRLMSPPGALYPFNVTVVANSCWENPAVSNLVLAALWSPLIVSCGLLGALGLSLVAMMRSVGRASELLRKTPDSVAVVTAATRVPWKEVRVMLTRALETSGANLHYFQAIIEEAEHDVNRELAREPLSQAPQQGRTISAILRKLVMDSRIASGAESLDAPLRPRSMTMTEVAAALRDQGFEITLPAGGDFVLTLADGDAFMRLVLNLGSNARKHSKGTARADLELQDQTLRLAVSNAMGMRHALRLRLAALLGAVDVNDPNVPLVRTWWSREGIGSRVLKRSAKTLGASLSLRTEGRSFCLAIDVPVQVQKKLEPRTRRRRAVGFVDPALANAARESGFEGRVLTPDELRTRAVMQEFDEVLVDFPLPGAPDALVVRNATTVARVRGIVTHWQGNVQ